MNADLLNRVLPPLPERLDADGWAEVNDVLDAATEWAAVRLPLEAFARIGTLARPAGGLPSAAYTRHVAARVMPTDPRWRALMRAFDTLADFHGYVRLANGGLLEPADILPLPEKYRTEAA